MTFFGSMRVQDHQVHVRRDTILVGEGDLRTVGRRTTVVGLVPGSPRKTDNWLRTSKSIASTHGSFQCGPGADSEPCSTTPVQSFMTFASPGSIV